MQSIVTFQIVPKRVTKMGMTKMKMKKMKTTMMTTMKKEKMMMKILSTRMKEQAFFIVKIERKLIKSCWCEKEKVKKKLINNIDIVKEG